jgi:hypothetical protein
MDGIGDSEARRCGDDLRKPHSHHQLEHLHVRRRRDLRARIASWCFAGCRFDGHSLLRW